MTDPIAGLPDWSHHLRLGPLAALRKGAPKKPRPIPMWKLAHLDPPEPGETVRLPGALGGAVGVVGSYRAREDAVEVTVPRMRRPILVAVDDLLDPLPMPIRWPRPRRKRR